MALEEDVWCVGVGSWNHITRLIMFHQFWPLWDLVLEITVRSGILSPRIQIIPLVDELMFYFVNFLGFISYWFHWFEINVYLVENGTVFKVFNNISGNGNPVIVEQIRVFEVCILECICSEELLRWITVTLEVE